MHGRQAAARSDRAEELRSIRDLALTMTDLPIGYCLDTATSWPPVSISALKPDSTRRSATLTAFSA
jgi:hypothetical protein